MVRHLEAVASSLSRLAPRLPEDITQHGLALYAQLSRLLSAPAETPEEVEALLLQWHEIEEHALGQQQLPQGPLSSESSASFSLGSSLLSGRQQQHGGSTASLATLPVSPLITRAFNALRSSTSSTTLDPMQSSRIHASASYSRFDMEQCNLSVGHNLDASISSLGDDGSESADGGPGARAGARARGAPKDDGEPSEAERLALSQLRWLVLGRATLGLLRWWLMALIDLSIKAAKARDWWQRQRRRPKRYSIWCGPRYWLRHAHGPPPPPHRLLGSTGYYRLGGFQRGGLRWGGLRIGFPRLSWSTREDFRTNAHVGINAMMRALIPAQPALMPALVLASLQSQLLRHAKQIGRLRHCLSALDHVADAHESLVGAVTRASSLIQAVVAEFAVEKDTVAGGWPGGGWPGAGWPGVPPLAAGAPSAVDDLITPLRQPPPLTVMTSGMLSAPLVLVNTFHQTQQPPSPTVPSPKLRVTPGRDAAEVHDDGRRADAGGGGGSGGGGGGIGGGGGGGIGGGGIDGGGSGFGGGGGGQSVHVNGDTDAGSGFAARINGGRRSGRGGGEDWGCDAGDSDGVRASGMTRAGGTSNKDGATAGGAIEGGALEGTLEGALEVSCPLLQSSGMCASARSLALGAIEPHLMPSHIERQ